MDGTLRNIISGLLGLAFGVPTVLMFILFLQGHSISEDNSTMAMIELIVAIGLVVWFAYAFFATVIEGRRLNKTVIGKSLVDDIRVRTEG